MMLRAAFLPPDDALAELRAVVGRLSLLPGVRPEPQEALDVRVAGFGNVVRADVEVLTRALVTRLPVHAPVVRFAGLSLTEDREVAVGLSGEVDELTAVARAVGTAAESVNLYIDRRRFRPQMVVATVEPQPPGSRVEAVLASLAHWEGSDWAVAGIALAKTRWLAGRTDSQDLGFVPFGAPAA